MLQHSITYLHNVQILLSVIQWFPTSKRKSVSDTSTQHAMCLLTSGAKQCFNYRQQEPIRLQRRRPDDGTRRKTAGSVLAHHPTMMSTIQSYSVCIDSQAPPPRLIKNCEL